MKKIVLVSGFLFLFTSVFLHAQDEKKKDKDKPKIEGSGNVIIKDVNVQSFNELSASGLFHVILKQGGKEEVKIEAEDNLQDLFEVKNEGSRLVIGMKKDMNIQTKKTMKVYVTFKSLKSLELKTVGNISSDGSLSFGDLKIENKSVGNVDLSLTAQSVNMENKSVGNVKLNGKADNAVIKNKSVGNIEATAFVVQKMEIDNDGVGSAKVNVEKELKVKDSFLGKVSNSGNAPVKKSNKVVI
jgi:hypothetical protein